MMKSQRILLSLLVLSAFSIVDACPIRIIADQGDLIVTDNAGHAAFIKKDETGIIDPAPQGLFSKMMFKIGLTGEKLFIYTKTQNLFELRLKLAERFCSDNDAKNTFTYSEIARQLERATARFNIKDYKEVKKPKKKKRKSKKTRKVRKACKNNRAQKVRQRKASKRVAMHQY